MPKDIKKLIEEALMAIEEPANAFNIAMFIANKTQSKHSNVLKNVRQALRSDTRSKKVLECNGYYYILKSTENCLQKIEEEEGDCSIGTEKQRNVPLHRNRRNKKSKPMENTTINTGEDTEYCTCTSTSSLQFLESVSQRDAKLIKKKKKLRNGKLSAEDRKNIPKPNTRKQLKNVKSSKRYNLRERPQKMLAVTVDQSKPLVQKKRNKRKKNTNNRGKYCTWSSDDKLDDQNSLGTKREMASIQSKRLKSNRPSNPQVDESDSMNEVGFLNSNSFCSILELVDLINHTTECQKCNQKVLAYTAELKAKYYNSSSYNLSSRKNLNLNKQNEDKIAAGSSNEDIVSNLQMVGLSDAFKEELFVNGKINDVELEPKNHFEDRDDEDDDLPSTSQQALERYFQNYRFNEPKSDDESPDESY